MTYSLPSYGSGPCGPGTSATRRARPGAMLSVASAFLSRLAPAEGLSRRDATSLAFASAIHLVALVVMAATEVDLVAKAAFLLAWAGANFALLLLLRRPIAAGLIALGF